MKKFKISEKIIGSVLLSLAATVFIIFASSQIIISSRLTAFFAKDVQTSSQNLNLTLKRMEKRAFDATAWFEGSKRLADAVKGGDRQYAVKLGKTAMESMGFNFFTIVDRKGNVFIRAHQPEKYGDSLAYQIGISRSLTGVRSSGIEEGTQVKYSIRAATPLKDQTGEILGVVSLGHNFISNEFLDEQKKTLDCDLSIYFGDTILATTLQKNGKRLVGEKLRDKEIMETVLKQKKNYSGPVSEAGKTYYAVYSPIMDLTGKASGILFTGKDMGIVSSLRTSMILYQSPIIAVIFIAVSIALIYLMRRIILLPIRKSVYLADKIASGDFTERLESSQEDEIGDLIRSLNRTATDLERLVGESVGTSRDLSTAITEVAQGNESLSQRTAEQASALEEIASTIEEASASISSNAESARRARELSQKSADLAKSSGQVIQGAISAIYEIAESSGRIEEIITLINDIAFQTNLLALNAAVEAARAGEQGRGFAVVAGEVRNLAQRSGSAAKEIGNLIRDSNGKVGQGKEFAQKSSEALSDIIRIIGDVNNLVAEIANTSEEQRSGMNQINISITELDEMTQKNAALVEQTSAASERMSDLEKTLLTMMERFKVGDGRK